MEKKFIGLRVPNFLFNKIKDIAYWERVTLSSFIIEAMQSHIGQYERERGSEYPKRDSYKKEN